MFEKVKTQGGSASKAGTDAQGKVVRMLNSLNMVTCTEGTVSGLLTLASNKALWGFDTEHLYEKSLKYGMYSVACEFPISFYLKTKHAQERMSFGILIPKRKSVIPLRVQSQNTDQGGTASQKIDMHFFRLLQIDTPISLMLIMGKFPKEEDTLEEVWDRMLYFNKDRRKVLLFRHLPRLRKYLEDGAPLPNAQKGMDFNDIFVKYADLTPHLNANEKE